MIQSVKTIITLKLKETPGRYYWISTEQMRDTNKTGFSPFGRGKVERETIVLQVVHCFNPSTAVLLILYCNYFDDRYETSPPHPNFLRFSFSSFRIFGLVSFLRFGFCFGHFVILACPLLCCVALLQARGADLFLEHTAWWERSLPPMHYSSGS